MHALQTLAALLAPINFQTGFVAASARAPSMLDSLAAACANPWVKETRNRFRHVLSMSAGDKKTVDRLRMRAERAALEAEKAALEVELLELKIRKLKSESKRGSDGRGEVSKTETQQVVPAFPRRPGTEWPEGREKWHRFITKDDPTFEKVDGYLVKTRTVLSTKRIGGVYDGSYRVQVTLPDDDTQVKTIELLQSCDGNATFGAVRLRAMNVFMGIERAVEKTVESDVLCSLISAQQQGTKMPPQISSKHVVVEQLVGEDFLKQELLFGKTAGDFADFMLGLQFGRDETQLGVDVKRAAKEQLNEMAAPDFYLGGIQKGDIIRAVSVAPKRKEKRNATSVVPWGLGKLGGILADGEQSRQVEQGFFFLDGRSPNKVEKMLEIAMQHDQDADIVLVVERPAK